MSADTGTATISRSMISPSDTCAARRSPHRRDPEPQPELPQSLAHRRAAYLGPLAGRPEAFGIDHGNEHFHSVHGRSLRT
jgi:hypothetical protein